MKKLLLSLVLTCLAVMSNLYAQIPLSGDILTNTTATAPRMDGGHGAYHIGPDIECNEDGRYTITWVQDVSPNYPSFHKSYKRGYNEMGIALSGSQEVVHANPPTAYIGSGDPKIAMKPNGDYIIVYYEFASPIGSPTSERIYFHKYFANGVQNGGRVFVDYGRYADIDIASDETFNISYRGETASNNSVAYVKRYSATGASAGPRITVDAAGTSHYDTYVQSRNNNEFTVCYKPDGPYSYFNFKAYDIAGINIASNVIPGRFTGKRNFIYKPNGDIVAVSVNNHNISTDPQYNMKNRISRFTPGGAVSEVLGSEITTDVSDYRIRYSTIEINTNGDYVIAFPKYENNQSLGIYLQQYNVNDQPVGPEYPVSTVDNTMIGVMLDVTECSFIVTWYSFNDEKIYHKRFKLYDEDFEITGNDVICSGDNSILTATEGYSNYLWSDGVTTSQAITATTAGTYSVTAWNGTQDECSPTATFELTVNPSPIIDLPSAISMCSGFEEICGPLAPNGSAYNYQWYGTEYDPLPTSVLLGEEMCFTPSETGNYTLIVSDGNCTSSHTILITEQLPQPDLGGDILISCEGDPIGDINILNQGFNNPDYTITWYHNNQEVQAGGETLMMSIEEGVITVVISYDGCESVSDSITITQQAPCCPDDLELVFSCDTGEITLENLPTDITIDTIFWNLNNDLIPNANDTSYQVLEPGTYSMGIIFTLPNGVECHHFIHITVTEDDCPNTLFCPDDLALAMNCEIGELYIENLPTDISINTIFWNLDNELIPGANDLNLAVSQPGTYSLGIIFTLPTGVECHHFIHFEYFEEYCCEETGPNPVATIINNNGNTYYLEETFYGPMTVPSVDCRLSIDGSLTTCEDSYHITIQAYDPVSWTSQGPIIFNQAYTGQAPSLIEIPQGILPAQSNGQFYIMTFYAGSPMTPTYIGFWYTCHSDGGGVRANNVSNLDVDISKNPISDQIKLYPNPTTDFINLRTNFDSASYQIHDLQGKLVNKGVINATTTLIDLSRFNSGIYFLRIISASGEVHVKKVIKE